MDWADDTRAVSQVIGALIVFSFVILAFSGYQAVVVPDQNAKVEYRHSQQVADEFSSLEAAIINTAGTSATRAQRVTLGTNYPPRIIAVNPPPVSGTLETTTSGVYETNLSSTPVDRACNGPDSSYDGATRAIQYHASYAQYHASPRMIYENSVAYRNYSGSYVFDSTQSLVQGSTVRIAPLTGGVSISKSDATSLTFYGGGQGSAAVNTVINPGQDTYHPWELTVPSQLPAEIWRNHDKLFNVDDAPGQTSVKDVEQSGPNEVTVIIEGGEYTLICQPVGVNQQPPVQLG